MSATDSIAWSTARGRRRVRRPPPLLRQPSGRHHLFDGGGQVGRDAQPLRDVPHPPPVAEIGGATPNTSTAPLWGVSRPSRIRSSVDLPDPLGRRARRTLRRAPRGSRGRGPLRCRRRTTRRAPRARRRRFGVEHDSHYGRSAPVVVAPRRECGDAARPRARRPRPRRRDAPHRGPQRGPAVGGLRADRPVRGRRGRDGVRHRFPRPVLRRRAHAHRRRHIALALGAIVVANRASMRRRPHLRAVPARDPGVTRERDPAFAVGDYVLVEAVVRLTTATPTSRRDRCSSSRSSGS